MKANELLIERQYLSESRERQIITEARALGKLLSEAINGAEAANIFQNIEKSMSDAGKNRTLLGKGKDAASYVNQTINKMGKWLQTTTPVQAFDQKFEQLKAKISTGNPKLTSALTAIGKFGKEHPAATAAIIGLLTTTAAVAAGPAGGAIAGQLLRGGMELMKGEKLSTAIGKGAKTAAIGYGLGKLADWTKEIITTAGGDRIVQYTFGKMGQVNFDDAGKITGPIITNSGTTINPGDPAYAEVSKKVMALFKQSQIDSAKSAVDFSNFMGDSVVLTTAQVNQLFEHIQNEGIGDWVKGKWDAAKGAVANKVATVGKNLTTKFTADKMLSAWKKAGAPEDAGAIVNVLTQMGVPKDMIQRGFDAAGKSQDYEAGVVGNEKGFDDAQAELGQAADAIKFGNVPSDAELTKMVAKAKEPNAPEKFREMVRQLLARRKELLAKKAEKDRVAQAKQAQKDRVAQANQAQKQTQQQPQQPKQGGLAINNPSLNPRAGNNQQGTVTRSGGVTTNRANPNNPNLQYQ